MFVGIFFNYIVCECPPPPEIMNGELAEDMSDPGNMCFVADSQDSERTQKTYICDSGYMFPNDGGETFQTQCRRRWDPSPPDCKREQSFSLFIDVLLYFWNLQ